MEIKYLPTCEVGVPDGYGDVENCGEPAEVWVKWSDGDALYVCKEHFEKLAEEIEESEDDDDR